MLELGLTILELPPIGGKLETRLLATRGTCQELSCVIFRHPEPCHQVKVPLYTIRLKRSIRKYEQTKDEFLVVTLLVDGDISWVGQLPHESIDITGRCRELPVNEDSNAIHVIPFTLRPVSSLNKKVISSLASTFTDTGQLAPTYNAESLSSSSSSGERPDGGDTCAISSIEAQVWRCRRVDNPLSSLDHLSTPPFDSDSAHILYSTKLRREGCASDGYNNAGYNDEGFYIPEMEIIIVDHGELILVERISDTPISSHTLILNRTNDE